MLSNHKKTETLGVARGPAQLICSGGMGNASLGPPCHGSQESQDWHANRPSSSHQDHHQTKDKKLEARRNRPRSSKTLQEHREILIEHLKYNRNPLFCYSVFLKSTHIPTQLTGKKYQDEAKRVFPSLRTWPTVGINGQAEFPANKINRPKPTPKTKRLFQPKLAAIEKAYGKMKPTLLAMEKTSEKSIPLAVQKPAEKPVSRSRQEPSGEICEELIRIPLATHRSMLLEYTLKQSRLHPEDYCSVLLMSEFRKLREDGRYWRRKERSRESVDVSDNLHDLSEALYYHKIDWRLEVWKIRYRPLAVRKAFKPRFRPVLSSIAQGSDEDEATCDEGRDAPVQGSPQEILAEDGCVEENTPENLFPTVTIVQCGSLSGSDSEEEVDEGREEHPIVGGVREATVHKSCTPRRGNIDMDAIHILEAAPICPEKMSRWKRFKRMFTCCLPARKKR